MAEPQVDVQTLVYVPVQIRTSWSGVDRRTEGHAVISQQRDGGVERPRELLIQQCVVQWIAG